MSRERRTTSGSGRAGARVAALQTQIDVTLDRPAISPEQIDQLADAAWAWRVPRPIAFFWKWLVGAALCLNFLGSFLVLGWVMRATRRTALKRWYKQAGLADQGMSFEAFCTADPAIAEYARWPNWMLGQRRGAGRSGIGRVVAAVFGSAWENLVTGVGGAFNLFVMTLPAGVLGWFAWYDGWNNSFNKGYEQYFVGMTVGAVGAVAFVAAMFYVPLAHARQCATGQWRTFYDYRLVWRIVRRRWLACLGLAAMFVIFSLPVMLMKVLPLSFEQNLERYHEMTLAEVVGFFWAYHFWWSVGLLPLYLIARLVAGRIYAGGVARGLRDGWIASEELAPSEHHVLERLDLITPTSRTERHVVVRAAGGATVWALRFAAALAMVLIWFTLVFQVAASAFFNYHEAHEWLNQPMIQLPWFNYIPAALMSAAGG